MKKTKVWTRVLLPLLGTLHFCYAFQTTEIDKSATIKSLLVHLDEGKTDEQSLLSYLERAKTIQSIGQKEQMSTFLEKIESIINLEKDNRIRFMFHLLKSRNLLFHHDYAQAIKQGENATKLTSFSKKQELIYNYSTIGSSYYYQSEYVKALATHQKALKICENNTEINCFAGIYNNLSVVYMGTGDWKQAEEYTAKAIYNAEQNNDDFEKSRAIGNMAIVFAEKGEFKKSEEWFLKDLEFDFIRGDSLSAARNYNNLGRLNEMQNQFTAAFAYYSKGLELSKLQNDLASVALGYQNLGWMQHKLGKNSQGLKSIQQGMQMTKRLGNRDKLRDAYLNISELYEALGQPDKALTNFMSYHDLNDSIIGEKYLKAIKELEIKYETEKKENELLKLSRQKQQDTS